jgi:hypothetical protein
MLGEIYHNTVICGMRGDVGFVICKESILRILQNMGFNYTQKSDDGRDFLSGRSNIEAAGITLFQKKCTESDELIFVYIYINTHTQLDNACNTANKFQNSRRVTADSSHLYDLCSWACVQQYAEDGCMVCHVGCCAINISFSTDMRQRNNRDRKSVV